jgi:hypothetical protein
MSSGEFQYMPSMDEKSLYSSENVRSNDPNLINQKRFSKKNSIKNLQVKGFTEEEEDVKKEEKQPKKLDYKEEYRKTIMLKKIMLWLVVLSGLNRLFAIFGYDIIIIFDYYISGFFRRRLYINFIVSLLISLGALYVYSVMKELYYPFMREAVVPEKLLNITKPKNTNFLIEVEVPPHSKVMYWAAEKVPNESNPHVKDAYGNYTNGGVVKASSKGSAKLYFNEGSGYDKPGKGHRPRHLHYRYILENSAFMSKIFTIYY